MSVIGWILFVFGLVRLAVSFANWLSPLYLPKHAGTSPASLVSILIPVRNEEKNIGNLLRDILSLTYQPLEVIIYNDSSTDLTLEVIKEVTRENKHIRVINGTELPPGWVGKNFACHQLALQAKGEKLFFLDADVRTGKEIIEKTLAYMHTYHLQLLSVFPTQKMTTCGTYLAVPLMNWILLSLLPLLLIRIAPHPALAAANGQYMCFDATTYHSIQPHRMVKNNPVEDIAIIKEYKKRGLPVCTLLGGEDIFCRMYTSLHEAINGFSKNVFQFFGGSPWITFLFGMITTLTPFYLAGFNSLPLALIYLGILVFIRVFISLASNQSPVKNVLLMIPQQLVFLKIILEAWIRKKQKNITWKGRTIFNVF